MSDTRGTGPLPTEAGPPKEEAARWGTDGQTSEQNFEQPEKTYPSKSAEASKTPRLTTRQHFIWIAHLYRDRQLTGDWLRVGLYVRERIDAQSGTVQMAQDEIEGALPITRATVNKALQRLEALAYIGSMQPPGRNGPKVYWLLPIGGTK